MRSKGIPENKIFDDLLEIEIEIWKILKKMILN